MRECVLLTFGYLYNLQFNFTSLSSLKHHFENIVRLLLNIIILVITEMEAAGFPRKSPHFWTHLGLHFIIII